MDLTPWAPAIALGGVVLGVIVTFVGQWLTRRQTSVLSIENQKAALRNDRREAIYHFLEAAETVHSMAMYDDDNNIGEITPERTEAEAELMYRQKCIDVVCRPDLREATANYTGALLRVLWGILERDVKMARELHEPQQKFFELARTELYAPTISD